MLAELQLVKRCANSWEIVKAESDEMDTPEQKVEMIAKVVGPCVCLSEIGNFWAPLWKRRQRAHYATNYVQHANEHVLPLVRFDKRQ
jgi:hypothetical protein